jgi:hypothetical protein
VILKPADPTTNGDRFARAGRRAEEQMAHYLERAFGTRDDILVFNDLRLEKGQDAAQIDHLLLHRWGMVIIESKSVTDSVHVNEHGEWSRQWNGRIEGMASPVLQAERQARFLRLYLEDYVETLLPKMLGVLQKRFGGMPVDVLVAISDKGIIKRAKGIDLPNVMKADQITDAARALYEKHRKGSSIFSMDFNEGYSLSTAEVDRIAAFLQEHHCPVHPQSLPEAVRPLLVREPTAPTPLWSDGDHAQSLRPHRPVSDRPMVSAAVPVQRPAPSARSEASPAAHTCRECESRNVAIVYGKYGYYFKCGACDGNTPIRLDCAQCAGREKIRKDGDRFFAECAVCRTSRLYYTNRSAN